MARQRTYVSGFMLVMLWLVPTFTSSARDEAFVVIVHPQNPATSIARTLLRSAYLKEGVTWRDGSVVVPIALADRFSARTHFVEDVLGKTPNQLKNHWVQRIFSGKGVPPIQVETPEEAIARVLADRHAVAYLPADADPGRAKVVAIH